MLCAGNKVFSTSKYATFKGVISSGISGMMVFSVQSSMV